MMRYEFKPIPSHQLMILFILHSFNNYFQQDDGNNPLIVSRSGQLINYALPTNKPNIGYNAPSLTDVNTRRKRRLSSTKASTCKKKTSSNQPPTVTSTQQINVLTDITSSPSEGNFLNSLHVCIHLDTNYIVNYQDTPKDQSEGEEEDSQSMPPRTSSMTLILTSLLL